MINPSQVTDFNRSRNDLEEFLLFSIYVAGKTAIVQAPKVHRCFLIPALERGISPFQFIARLIDNNELESHLKEHRMGKYEITLKGLPKLINRMRAGYTLNSITREELEKIDGIGYKTSRFFLLHSRPMQEYIVFDTHLSRWFNENGVVPFLGTPTPKQYEKYEPIAIEYLKERYALGDFAAFDLNVWNQLTKAGKTAPKKP